MPKLPAPSATFPILHPTLDVVFRRFFGEPEAEDLLIDFLTAVLRPASPIRSVKVLKSRRRGPSVIDKDIVLDLIVELDNGRRVNVEMQCRADPAMVERSVVYLSRTHASRLRRGQPYSALQGAVFVGILGHVLFPDGPFHSRYRLREDSTGRPLTDLLELHFIQLPKLRETAGLDAVDDGRHDPLVTWSRFFVARTDDERAALERESPIMRRAIERLVLISEDPSLQDEAEKRRVDKMLAEYGRQKELDATRAEALVEGRAEGRAEAHAEYVPMKRELLQHVLQSRFGALPHDAHECIGFADPGVLDRLIVVAKTAESVDEVLDSID